MLKWIISRKFEPPSAHARFAVFLEMANDVWRWGIGNAGVSFGEVLFVLVKRLFLSVTAPVIGLQG